MLGPLKNSLLCFLTQRLIHSSKSFGLFTFFNETIGFFRILVAHRFNSIRNFIRLTRLDSAVSSSALADVIPERTRPFQVYLVISKVVAFKKIL